MSNNFRTKIDWWLPVFFLVLLAWTTAVVLLDRESEPWAHVAVLAVDILVIWLLVGIRYDLGESDLKVIFGPFRFRYPLHEVVRVRKGGWWAQVSSLREPRLRLALSRDNIIVECRRGGRPRRVVISPRNAPEFILLFKERAPQARFEGL